MAAAKLTFVSFFGLLVLTVSATAISIPAGDIISTRPATALPFPSTERTTTEEAVADCWKAVLQAESCAVDVLRWLASPERATVRVGAACCGVLVRIGDTCLHELFPSSMLGAIYAPLVRHACGIPLSVSHGGRQ